MLATNFIFLALVISSPFSSPAMSSMYFSRGYMMCASNNMLPDVIKMIRQTRDMWNSSLAYSVSHCSEITQDGMKSVWDVEPSVRFIDLCKKSKGSAIFGMEPSWARKRLRGFFCKVGALLASPFNETMILDLDVVWLARPDDLFHSKQYAHTGTLFFRSRIFHYQSKRHGRDRISVETLLPFFEQHGVTINRQTIHDMATGNGISLFWLHVQSRLNNSLSSLTVGATSLSAGITAGAVAAGRGGNINIPIVNKNKTLIDTIVGSEADLNCPLLSDFQDSSVLLVDSARHPKFLKVLKLLLPSFAMGYGDKETFWVAATISGEPFAFEPFLAGQYGDCYGVQLHYDPRDADLLLLPEEENEKKKRGQKDRKQLLLENKKTPRPFYLNAEYFVEKELTCVGEFVRTRMVRPRLVTLSPDLRDSRAYEKSYLEAESKNYSCTCDRIGCVIVPAEANRYLLYVQWLTISQKVHMAALNEQENILLQQQKKTSSDDNRMAGMGRSMTGDTAPGAAGTTTAAAAAAVIPAAFVSTSGGTDSSSAGLRNVSSGGTSGNSSLLIRSTTDRSHDAAPAPAPAPAAILGSISISDTEPSPHHCIPVLASLHQEVNDLFMQNISGKRRLNKEGRHAELCYSIGCPLLPIQLDTTLPWLPKTLARYCEPVLFSPLNSSSMRSRSKSSALQQQRFAAAVVEARSPHSKWNSPVFPNGALLQNSQTKRYYLVKDNQTHLIPNKATFLKLGLEFPHAISVPPYKLGNLPTGTNIQPM